MSSCLFDVFWKSLRSYSGNERGCVSQLQGAAHFPVSQQRRVKVLRNVTQCCVMVIRWFVLKGHVVNGNSVACVYMWTYTNVGNSMWPDQLGCVFITVLYTIYRSSYNRLNIFSGDVGKLLVSGLSLQIFLYSYCDSVNYCSPSFHYHKQCFIILGNNVSFERCATLRCLHVVWPHLSPV